MADGKVRNPGQADDGTFVMLHQELTCFAVTGENYRNLLRRRHLHLATDVADAADYRHDAFHIGSVLWERTCVTVSWVGGLHDCRGCFCPRQCLPYFLGDKRHERVQQA